MGGFLDKPPIHQIYFVFNWKRTFPTSIRISCFPELVILFSDSTCVVFFTVSLVAQNEFSAVSQHFNEVTSKQNSTFTIPTFGEMAPSQNRLSRKLLFHKITQCFYLIWSFMF